uniref:Replication protein A 70 kDa DNA-binding subunit B/D first OB fold domain-containing protein n=2 Tax=Oryza sativa subsp. japonica TaxID=39947 RepID=Q8H862_ORYSJ|nr:putative DNA binding protein [Oryza sativa Japonica Group]AAP52594.1 hypothetical protein LOC_Os10g11780 [Oryza sativa Japonica Group]
MAHVLISQLSFGDSNKRIHARVSRLWNFTDLNDDTKIFHTDLVLLDEIGTSIHAQIYPPITEKMKPLLKEEKVYYIDSFTIRAANRTYRPVANNLMILFSKWTTLEEHINVPPHFPSITFSLTPFEDVPSLVEKNSFYVDIMGVITEVGAVTTIRPKSRNAESLKRTLQIRDASAGQTQAQVVVFVGTLVKDYRGLGLTLTGSSPCKWYINLNIPKVAELNESFSTNFQPIKWVDEPATGYNQDVPEEKSTAEILNINPHKHKGTRFIVNVTVRRICNEYSCWYKVVLIAGDDDANATFILFGRIAQRLLRRPIESLIEENPPNSEYIPSEITSLIGSNFAWNVSFTRDTVMRSQECLQVNSIISSGASNQPLLLMSPDASSSLSLREHRTPQLANQILQHLPRNALLSQCLACSLAGPNLKLMIRGMPTPTATPPVAKKLFKYGAQQKGNDSE